MKKLLIGLTLLGSFSSFAETTRDHYTAIGVDSENNQIKLEWTIVNDGTKDRSANVGVYGDCVRPFEYSTTYTLDLESDQTDSISVLFGGDPSKYSSTQNKFNQPVCAVLSYADGSLLDSLGQINNGDSISFTSLCSPDPDYSNPFSAYVPKAIPLGTYTLNVKKLAKLTYGDDLTHTCN